MRVTLGFASQVSILSARAASGLNQEQKWWLSASKTSPVPLASRYNNSRTMTEETVLTSQVHETSRRLDLSQLEQLTYVKLEENQTAGGQDKHLSLLPSQNWFKPPSCHSSLKKQADKKRDTLHVQRWMTDRQSGQSGRWWLVRDPPWRALFYSCLPCYWFNPASPCSTATPEQTHGSEERGQGW